MAKPARTAGKLTDAEIVERVQSIFINAVEGRRSIADDRQYPQLRKEFARRKLTTPSPVTTHPTVDSFMAAMKGKDDDRKQRVQRVLEDFGPILLSLHSPDMPATPSAAWTGNPDRVARLKVIRELLPQARSTVQAMIDELSKPGPNGGPLLDETEEALEQLKELHRTLGDLLAAIDSGRFDDDLGQGLAAEAARRLKQAAKNLRDDPVPHAVALLIYGIFTACGFPGVGSQLGSSAKDIMKSQRRKG